MKYTKVFLFLRIYIQQSKSAFFFYLASKTQGYCTSYRASVQNTWWCALLFFFKFWSLPLFTFASSLLFSFFLFFFFNFHWFICWEVEEELFLPEKTSCTALVFAAFETVKFSLHPHFLLPLGVGTWQNIFVFQSESNYHKLLCLA